MPGVQGAAMSEKKKQHDAGAGRGKVKVLRARDIIPGNDTPAGPVTTDEHNQSRIPSFDLAQRIMSEQRKATATRRKGPGRSEPAVPQQPSTSSKRGSMSIGSEHDDVIAEIVKRDIERLCRGEQPI